MVACPLCVLGLPEEEHTPENWKRLTTDPEWAAEVDAFNQQHPGVRLDEPPIGSAADEDGYLKWLDEVFRTLPRPRTPESGEG